MRRRARIRDLPGLLLAGVEQAQWAAEIRGRIRRADYRRPGSLTYNRRRALEAYGRQQRTSVPDDP